MIRVVFLTGGAGFSSGSAVASSSGRRDFSRGYGLDRNRFGSSGLDFDFSFCLNRFGRCDFSNRFDHGRFNNGLNHDRSLLLDRRGGLHFLCGLCSSLGIRCQRSGIALDIGARLTRFHLNCAGFSGAVRFADFTRLLARDGDFGFAGLGCAAMHLAQIVEQMRLVRFGDRVDDIVFADTRRLQLFKQQLRREFQF